MRKISETPFEAMCRPAWNGKLRFHNVPDTRNIRHRLCHIRALKRS
jgi:hypothetical protein